MRYTDPDALEFNQDIYNTFKGQNKDFLIRFFNHFVDNIEDVERGFSEDTKKTAGDLSKIIATDLVAEAEEFLQKYRTISDEGIRINPATQYLAENYDIPPDELECSSVFDLLLIIYEQDLIENLDDLIVGINLRRNAWKRSYTVDEQVELDGLVECLDKFHEDWNNDDGEDDIVPIRIFLERTKGNSATLQIHREKQSGSNIYPTFSFRKNPENNGIPAKPEISREEVFDLKSMRFRVESKPSHGKIIFTDDITGWRRLLDQLFDDVFGISEVSTKIRPKRDEEVEEVESQFEMGIESDDDPLEAAQKTIQGRKESAKSEVDKKGLPPSKADKLKEIIDTVEICGSDIEDDPSINTSSFRLVGELPEVFKAVDIEAGFKDMLETADPDKRSFVIRVNTKAVALENGRWRKLDPGSLGDMERQALETLFSGEEVEVT